MFGINIMMWDILTFAFMCTGVALAVFLIAFFGGLAYRFIRETINE